MAEKEKI